MFYYLIYNSSLVNKLFENEETIKIMIYGSIAYIVCHCILYSSSIFNNLKGYFWLLLSLDLACIYLLYNGTLNGKLKIETKIIDSVKKDELEEILKDNEDINNQHNETKENEFINNQYNETKENEDVKKNIKSKEEKYRDNELFIDQDNLTNKNISDIENIKMEIKETLISKNKNIGDSESELGSDIDIDSFENTL